MSRSAAVIRDALLTGLAWAIAWAPVALVIGITTIDPDNSMDEMWFVVGAYPGFLSGVFFRIALAVAGDVRLHTISRLRAGLLGAASGMLIGTLPFLLGDSRTTMPAWTFARIVIGTFVLGSAVSGVATASWARMMARRRLQPR